MAVALQLAHNRRRYGGVFGQGEEYHGLDAGQTAVYVGHVALILEVFDAADAPQQVAGAALAGEVNCQAAVGSYLDGIDACINFFDGVDTGGHVVVGFGAVVPDADYDSVEQAETAAHYRVVAYGKGVERPGEERDALAAGAVS